MILVLFLFMVITIIVISLIIILSSIKLKIERFKIDGLKINEYYKVIFQICFLNKVKLFSKKIDVKKIYEKRNKKRKNIKIDENPLELICMLKPKLEMINLNVNLGYEDACIISYIVGILNGVLSIILPYFISKSSSIKYVINPIYNQNVFNLEIDSIISVKIVHIIYVIWKLKKKGMMDNERTSNRRFNVNSYE